MQTQEPTGQPFPLAEVRERTRAYFDAVGKRYLELFRDELERKPRDRELLARIASELASGARVCDVGCGPCGHVARFLCDRGLEVIGVDLSERCIELARAQAPGFDFRVMDMLAMDFETGSLDGLVAYYAILYTPKASLRRLFAEFARVLRHGGRLLVVVKEGQGEGYIEDPMGTGELTFFANFTEEELQGLLQAGGFRCLLSEVREPYPFEFPVRRISILAEKP